MVTVVIPTRNRPRLLATRALPTALAQEGVAIEVIVVDDGSEPPVEVPGDPRARLIRHSIPRGVAAARNAGIGAAEGEWVAFLDDDDLWSPLKLREQLAALAGGGDFCYSAAVLLDGGLRPMRIATAPSPSRLLGELARRNVLPAGSSNVVARRALLRELGGFDESFGHLDDWDCWLRLADGHVARACESVLVAYILHAGGRVQHDYAGQGGELDRLADKHADLERRIGTALDRHDFARYLAVSQRRAGHPVAAARTYLASAREHRSVGDLARAGAAVARLAPRVQPRIAVPDWVAPQLAQVNR
jgi:hypothetical protein